MMKELHTTSLTLSQKEDINKLVTTCCEQEPLTLSAPMEDGLDYFLYYDEDRLIAMLFLFFPEEAVCECGAYTLPSERRKGYFSNLLDAALDYVESYEVSHGLSVDFCFLSDGHSPCAAAVIKALGAAYWYSEYTMTKSLSSLYLPAGDSPAGGRLTIEDADSQLYTASLNGQIIGVCMTIPNGASVYFYGFEIKESYREQGYGLEFLLGMIKRLSKDYQKITLQVSGQNVPALSLYKKAGFGITETLSYYLY